MTCDNCNLDKMALKGFYLETENGKVWVTWCEDCLGYRVTGKTDKEMQEYINTPYWLHMGVKPNLKEKAQLKYLKDHNMSWTDYSKQRNLGAKSKGGLESFKKHQTKYGRKNAPEAKFGKESKAIK
jgi:long-subunit fatty acid transport protein